MKENVIENRVKYGICKEKDGKLYVVIYGLYVHPVMRGNGVASVLLTSVINRIRFEYPEIIIKVEAEPFGSGGLNKEQLINFYSNYNVEIIGK